MNTIGMSKLNMISRSQTTVGENPSCENYKKLKSMSKNMIKVTPILILNSSIIKL